MTSASVFSADDTSYYALSDVFQTTALAGTTSITPTATDDILFGDFVGGDQVYSAGAGADYVTLDIVPLADSYFAVLWRDYKISIYDSTGSRIGAVIEIDTDYSLSNPTALGLSDGGFVAMWTDLVSSNGGSQRQLVAQIYDADGNPVGSEFVVNETDTASAGAPSDILELANGNFVTVWQSFAYNFDTAQFERSVFARVFDATGHAVSSEFLVNAADDQSAWYLEATALDDGGFAITWNSENTGSTSSENSIVQQIYSSDGQEVSSETIVNKNDFSTRPSLHALSTGGFVLIGRDYSDNSSTISATVYNADWSVRVSEFILKQEDTEAYSFSAADVAELPDGRFFFIWTYSEDIDDILTVYTVSGQVFDADGTPIGDEIPILSDYAYSPPSASITSLENGSVVVEYTQIVGDDKFASGSASFKVWKFEATDENTSLVFEASDLLSNDVDLNGDELVISAIDTSQTLGTVTDNGNGTFTYDPNGQFAYLGVGETATDTFEYTVSDGNGGEDTATVTVTISGVNDAPVASDLALALDENSTITGYVLASDVDGTDLTYSLIADAANGTVRIGDDGALEYTPDTDFFGADSFVFAATDAYGATDTATVSLTVNLVRDSVSYPRLPDTSLDLDLLDGLEFTDFVHGSRIAIGDIGRDVTRDDFTVTPDGTVSIEGVTFSVDADLENADFLVVNDDDGANLVLLNELTGVGVDLREGVSLGTDEIHGIMPGVFFEGDGEKDFSITFDGSVAGYQNVLGAYEISSTGEITNVVILFDNASQTPTGQTALIEDVADGSTLAFFLIQDGADRVTGFSDELVFDTSGTLPALRHDGTIVTDLEIFHSYDTAMNADGAEHFTSGIVPQEQALRIGVEDLTGGGDQDFQDLVFTVEIV